MSPLRFERNFLKETNFNLLTEVRILEEILLLTTRLFLCIAVYVMQFLFPWRDFYTVIDVLENGVKL
jgi:hypothetical protein